MFLFCCDCVGGHYLLLLSLHLYVIWISAIIVAIETKIIERSKVETIFILYNEKTQVVIGVLKVKNSTSILLGNISC